MWHPSEYSFFNGMYVYSQLLHYFCLHGVAKQQVKEHLQSKRKLLIAESMSLIIFFMTGSPICEDKQIHFTFFCVYL